MAVRTRLFVAAVSVLVLVAFGLALAMLGPGETDDAVPGITRNDYPRVGITRDETPRTGEQQTPCRSASDGSIIARPFQNDVPPLPPHGPDSYAPPTPEVPWERQDCPSV